MAKEFIDYNQVIKIIKEQEKKEERELIPDKSTTPTLSAKSIPAAIPTPTKTPTPAVTSTTSAGPTADARLNQTAGTTPGARPTPTARQVQVAPSTLATKSTPAAKPTSGAGPTPAENTLILDKRHDGDNQSLKVVVKDHLYSPVKESIIKNSHISQDSQPKNPNILYSQPKRPQPVSPTGSCSSDSIILHNCE